MKPRRRLDAFVMAVKAEALHPAISEPGDPSQVLLDSEMMLDGKESPVKTAKAQSKDPISQFEYAMSAKTEVVSQPEVPKKRAPLAPLVLPKKITLEEMSSLTCTICLDVLYKPVVTQCLHRFCKECIGKHFRNFEKKDKLCPLCNKQFSLRGCREDNRTERIVAMLFPDRVVIRDQEQAIVESNDFAAQECINSSGGYNTLGIDHVLMGGHLDRKMIKEAQRKHAGRLNTMRREAKAMSNKQKGANRQRSLAVRSELSTIKFGEWNSFRCHTVVDVLSVANLSKIQDLDQNILKTAYLPSVTGKKHVSREADSFQVRVRGPRGGGELREAPSNDTGVSREIKSIYLNQSVSGELVEHTFTPYVSPPVAVTGYVNNTPVAGAFGDGRGAYTSPQRSAYPPASGPSYPLRVVNNQPTATNPALYRENKVHTTFSPEPPPRPRLKKPKYDSLNRHNAGVTSVEEWREHQALQRLHSRAREASIPEINTGSNTNSLALQNARPRIMEQPVMNQEQNRDTSGNGNDQPQTIEHTYGVDDAEEREKRRLRRKKRLHSNRIFNAPRRGSKQTSKKPKEAAPPKVITPEENREYCNKIDALNLPVSSHGDEFPPLLDEELGFEYTEYESDMARYLRTHKRPLKRNARSSRAGALGIPYDGPDVAKKLDKTDSSELGPKEPIRKVRESSRLLQRDLNMVAQQQEEARQREIQRKQWQEYQRMMNPYKRSVESNYNMYDLGSDPAVDEETENSNIHTQKHPEIPVPGFSIRTEPVVPPRPIIETVKSIEPAALASLAVNAIINPLSGTVSNIPRSNSHNNKSDNGTGQEMDVDGNSDSVSVTRSNEESIEGIVGAGVQEEKETFKAMQGEPKQQEPPQKKNGPQLRQDPLCLNLGPRVPIPEPSHREPPHREPPRRAFGNPYMVNYIDRLKQMRREAQLGPSIPTPYATQSTPAVPRAAHLDRLAKVQRVFAEAGLPTGEANEQRYLVPPSKVRQPT